MKNRKTQRIGLEKHGRSAETDRRKKKTMISLKEIKAAIFDLDNTLAIHREKKFMQSRADDEDGYFLQAYEDPEHFYDVEEPCKENAELKELISLCRMRGIAMFCVSGMRSGGSDRLCGPGTEKRRSPDSRPASSYQAGRNAVHRRSGHHPGNAERDRCHGRSRFSGQNPFGTGTVKNGAGHIHGCAVMIIYTAAP